MPDITQDDWPEFAATRHTPPGSQFRIGTRSVFVDTPNGLIEPAIARIHQIEEAHDTPHEAYEVVQKDLDDINDLVRRPLEELTGEDCDWINLQVVHLPSARKPYNIQIHFRWEELLKFLETIAASQDIPFTNKYQYVFNCRNIKLLPQTESTWISAQQKAKVQDFVSDEIQSCHTRLSTLQEIVARVSGTCREKNFIHLYYLYSKDCLHSLDHVDELLDDGRITACYRELRNIIEELSVALFYDRLVLGEQEIDEPYSLPYPVHDWFDRAREQKETVRNLRELRKYFSGYIQSIKESTDAPVSKDDIWNNLVDNLSVSLFIVAASTDKHLSDWRIETEARKVVRERAVKATERLLLDVTETSSLSSAEQELSQDLVEQLMPNQDFWVRFPTGFLARQYVSKFFSEDLNTPYTRYSHFSHAYPDSWQIAPGSSILEYKLFNTEFHRTAGKFEAILTAYRESL